MPIATQSISALRSQRDGLDQQVYAGSVQLQQLQSQLAQAQRSQPGEVEQLQAQLKNLQATQVTNQQGLIAARAALGEAIGNLYGQGGPQQLIAQLPDDVPIALLPVRIETRFNVGNAGGNTPSPVKGRAVGTTSPVGITNELWVRVYPDDVAIVTHEKTLTDQEVTAGETYWQALYAATKTASEDDKKAAWTALVTHFGSGRAAWVALQTKPTNWTDDLSGITDVSQLVFPVFNLTKTQAWSQAPRTNVMPDKFVVMLYTGTTKVAEVTGNLVPDELIVGPDPMDADNSFVTTGTQLSFGPDFDWASDFDRAVTLGMGFRIPLTAQQALDGFDRLLVMGLYLSRDETDSQQALEDLIDNHHYSTQGFSLVPQGAPTHNTTQDSSAFSKADPFDNLSYLVEAGTPLFAATDDCDGKNMADALGIDYEVLQHVAYSDGTDNRDAVLMNEALFPGTLGYYLGSMLDPVLAAAAQQNLSDFYTRYVTGRGPLPAFRVGNQPYGILLTSDFSAWKMQEREATYPAAFMQTLYKVLNDYQQIWLGLQDKLLYTGKAGADPGTVLLNILGLQAGASTFYQRNAYSTDNLYNLDAFEFGGKYFADAQKNFVSKTLGLAWLQALGYTGPEVPQILRLVYQHFTTTLDPANLVDKVPVSETSPLSVNYLDWLAAATTADELNQQDFGAGIAAPTSLLYLMLRKALLQTLHSASVSWFEANGADVSATLGAINFHNIRPGGTLTKWEVMKAPLSVAAPAHALANLAVADYLLGPGKTEPQALVPQGILSVLSELSGNSTASLQRCFSEHIDTLTYRLDSWQTALFDIRLRNQRNIASAAAASAAAATNDKNPRKQGIYLGAYGWLENIRPSARQKVPAGSLPPQLQPADQGPVYTYSDNGGLVHAPSINHASAAAVLRSGYLSHADVGTPDALSVNLSSARVRSALLVMEGIRNGQTLPALLGYQFERGLHDRADADNSLLRLNEYIYEFRTAFPVQTTLVQQQGNAPQETIPADDVVDGLALSESTLAFPYGATGDVTSANAAEIAAITAEKNNLADTLDAIKDTLTVESVYQLVLGNYDRVTATVNALQNGDLPPVLESLDTPRGNQFGFTNRITIQFANADPTSAAANPWPPIPLTARATMETGVNLWLQTILGAPTATVVQVSQLDAAGNNTHTMTMGLDQLGIQPIDLIYIIGTDLSTGVPRAGQENKTGASELECRFAYAYRAANGLDDSIPVNIAFLQPQGVAGQRPLGQWLPTLRALKSMITDSRYLNAQDFNPPTQTASADPNNPKGYDTAELTTRIQRVKTNYEQQLQVLQNIPIQAQVDATVYNTLGTAFTALDTAGSTFADSTVTFAVADATTLRNQMIVLANLSFGNAFPNVTSPSTDALQLILLEQARSVSALMTTADQNATTLMTQAASITDPAKAAETLINAGKALLGDDFNILPLFTYNNESDILQSDADRAQLLANATTNLGMIFPADEWMQGAAQVRPRLSRWDTVRMLSEVGGATLPLKPVQVPYMAKDSWLAVEVPATDALDPTQPFTVTQDTLSVTIHGDQAFVQGTSHSGILIDEWTEAIPTQEQITGITFNYNQPAAFPPQAILLAVPPAVTGAWNWDELVGILQDTLLRAKLRAVEPELLATVDKVESSVLLPALLSNFTQYDLDISLDYRMNINYVGEKLPVKAVTNQ